MRFSLDKHHSGLQNMSRCLRKGEHTTLTTTPALVQGWPVERFSISYAAAQGSSQIRAAGAQLLMALFGVPKADSRSHIMLNFEHPSCPDPGFILSGLGYESHCIGEELQDVIRKTVAQYLPLGELGLEFCLPLNTQINRLQSLITQHPRIAARSPLEAFLVHRGFQAAERRVALFVHCPVNGSR